MAVCLFPAKFKKVVLAGIQLAIHLNTSPTSHASLKHFYENRLSFQSSGPAYASNLFLLVSNLTDGPLPLDLKVSIDYVQLFLFDEVGSLTACGFL